MSEFENAPPVPPRHSNGPQQRNWTSNPNYSTTGHPMFFSSPSPQYPFFNPFGNNFSQPPPSLTYRANSVMNSGAMPGLQMLAGVESFVTTINSIAALFESSYMALSTSLRAVLSTGDQLANLRSELWKILQAVSLIRGVKWVVRRVLVFLRLIKPSSGAEEAWQEGKQKSHPVNASKNCSAILFFAFVLGGPWLLYRLLNGSMQSVHDKLWMREQGPHYVAKAKFDFAPSSSDEISLEKGQKVVVATSKDYVGWDVPADWLLVSTDGDVCGLAPASYLELVKNNSRLEYNTTTNSRSRLNCDDKFEIM